MSQTSELLTVIENDHLNQIAQWRRLIYIVMAILIVCLLALDIPCTNRDIPRDADDTPRNHCQDKATNPFQPPGGCRSLVPVNGLTAR